MPRLSAITSPTLRELDAQLRHAPRETLLRDVARVEQLAPDVRPGVSYPPDWIVHRVTGFRPETASGAPEEGAALRRDLSAFCERLCARAGLHKRELPGGAFITQSELAAQHRISTMTLKRLRREGLVARRAVNERGKQVTIYSRAHTEVFFREGRSRAGERTQALPARRTRQERARLVRAATRYARLGLSLHQSAVRLAARNGRSVEGVRHVLKTAHELTETFPASTKSSARRRRALARLWRAGTPAPTLATLAKKSVQSVRRDIAIARAEDLRRWLRQAPVQAEHAHHPRGDEPWKSSAGLRAALSTPWSDGTLHEVVALWRTREACPKAIEQDACARVQACLLRAHACVQGLERLHPSSRSLDDAETLLREVSALLRAVLRPQQRVIVEAIEARCGRELASLPARSIGALLLPSLRAAVHAALSFCPARGGRLAAGVAIGADRACARVLKESPGLFPPTTRASVVQAQASWPWLCALVPWDGALLLRDRARAVVARAARGGVEGLSAEHAGLLDARFGVTTGVPRSLESLRRELGVTDAVLARRLEAAVASVLAASRVAAR